MFEVTSKCLIGLVLLQAAACSRGAAGGSSGPEVVLAADSRAGSAQAGSIARARAANGRAAEGGSVAGSGGRAAEGGSVAAGSGGRAADGSKVAAGSGGRAAEGGAGARAAGGAGGSKSSAAGGGAAGSGGSDPGASMAGQGGAVSLPDLDSASKLAGSELRLGEVVGYYSGEWGELALALYGPELRGSYSRNAGTLLVRPRADGVLAGFWSEAPARMAPGSAGEIELRFVRSGDVISVAGRYRNGAQGAWVEDLDLLLVNEQDAPAELDARLDDADAFKRAL